MRNSWNSHLVGDFDHLRINKATMKKNQWIDTVGPLFCGLLNGQQLRTSGIGGGGEGEEGGAGEGQKLSAVNHIWL